MWHSLLLIFIANLLAPTIALAYIKPKKLSGSSMTWKLAASTFPNADTARQFAHAATRTWQTFGGAAVALTISPTEPAVPSVNSGDGENHIFYETGTDRCAGINGKAWPLPVGGPFTSCDIVICEWETDRSDQSYTLKVMTHEIGHCLGFDHEAIGFDAIMAGGGSEVRWTFLSQDDVDGLYAAPAYARKSNTLQTKYSDNGGISWTVLSEDVGTIANAAFRKPDIAQRGSSNRYAIAYSDTADNLRVVVSDGNNTIDSDADTGGNTFSGAGIAWVPGTGTLVALYRAKSDSYLYSRVSSNHGATWSSYVQVGGPVASTVDIAWSPNISRYFAVAESSSTGILMLFSSANGYSWTTHTLTNAPYTAGGASISCSSALPWWCVVAVNRPENLNTAFRWFTPTANAAVLFDACCGTVTDGSWSAGEVEIALDGGDVDGGTYLFRGEYTTNYYRSWLGTFSDTTGTVREYITDWLGPSSLVYGEYYDWFIRATARP